MSFAPSASPYEALLLVSFGGPEGPDDVLPFLENVTRGRGIPTERLREVGEHYFRFGGVSPINAQCRALIAAIEADFAAHGLDLPVYWGNRNWTPYLGETVRQMAADGIGRAIVFVTAAYASYSGCRQYREDIAMALAGAGAAAPALDKLRHYFNHPGFVIPTVEATVAALDTLPTGARADAHLAFVTHSIPVSLAETSGPSGGAYVAQHREVASLVAGDVERKTGRSRPWGLIYQSRSGPPNQPWLSPDVCDHLETLRAGGAPGVVIVPIGFVSDHMEVIYDLDTEAMALADKICLPAARAGTVGTHPRFVAAIRELVLERAAAERGERPPRPALGALGPSHDVCRAGCCPNPRGPQPAACGA